MIHHELRINNWVESKGDGSTPKYGKVTQVYMDGFTVDYHYPGGWYSPVLITPEILEENKFIKNGGYWEKGVFSVQRIPREDGTELLLVPNNYLAAIELKHIHQLQNIYFFLVGSELPITLK